MLLYLLLSVLFATTIDGIGYWDSGYLANTLKSFGMQTFFMLAINSVGIFLCFATKKTAAVIGAFIAIVLVPLMIVSLLVLAFPGAMEYTNYDLVYQLIIFAQTASLSGTAFARGVAIGLAYLLIPTIGGIMLFRKAEIKKIRKGVAKMIIAICIILGLLLITCLLRLIFLKREVRHLNLALLAIVNADTNAQLTTLTSDKYITAFVKTINAMLERNRRDFVEKVRTETDLKRAITNISHDLRTPLTSARGYLQMLESSELDAATKARYLAIIQERLDALQTLMNSLFEFARVMEGDVTINMQPINICNVLRDVLSANFTELDSRGFTVDADIPDTPVLCLCDADALQRVLQNLIKNAYTHGREYLRIRLHGSTIEIANKLNGQIDTSQIFDRFYTADASRSNKSTGLGLAIVKELMARMGGQVSASAEDDVLVMRVVLPQDAS